MEGFIATERARITAIDPKQKVLLRLAHKEVSTPEAHKMLSVNALTQKINASVLVHIRNQTAMLLFLITSHHKSYQENVDWGSFKCLTYLIY